MRSTFMTLRRQAFVTGALLTLALPVLAAAQPGAPGAPQPPVRPRGEVSRILDARRKLDLTARQLVQLDSIERAEFAARRATTERMRVLRDSMRASMQGDARRGERTGAQRDSMRAQARARVETMRPQLEQMRRRDSVARSAAERVLTESQRQQLREMRAEERGRQRGLREARVRGEARGTRGPGGVRRPDGMRRPGSMRRPEGPRDAPMPREPRPPRP